MFGGYCRQTLRSMRRAVKKRRSPSGRTAATNAGNNQILAKIRVLSPVIEVDGIDFGLSACRVILKLELLQHAGSFKTRGAFANLLLREIPEAGVAAASGGNHGVAVAYAAMRLGKRARIFVPGVASPTKVSRIRECGADLVVTGERYADALEACQAWAATSGANVSACFFAAAIRQPSTLPGGIPLNESNLDTPEFLLPRSS